MDAVTRRSARGAGRRIGAAAACIAALLALSACEKEPLLEGQRLDVRAPLPEPVVPGPESAAEIARVNAAAPAPADPELRDTQPEPVLASRAVPIGLPAQANHAEWGHRGGSVRHTIQHPALAPSLTPLWSVRLGEANSRRARITADPVAGGGRLFAMDARSTVSAISPAGGVLWQVDLTPPGERQKEASGGGLAYAGGRLYVTTGFGRLHVLDPATGREIWEQQFDAPVGGSPTVLGDLVYVASRDSRAFAIRTDNGRLEWELPGAPTGSVAAGGAAPAVTDRIAVFPFGSAELVTTLRQGGVRLWSSSVAGQRRGRAYTGVTDITADPVIVGDTIYAGSPSGRTVAFDATSGERTWTATEGAMSPVVPVGGAIFLVSDQGQLVRLNASDGSVVWRVSLPLFTKEKARKRLAVIPHYGPVLAGGRLYVGSGDERLRAFDPASGALVAEYPLPGGAASNPIVVNRVLYIVSARGVLHAYR